MYMKKDICKRRCVNKPTTKDILVHSNKRMPHYFVNSATIPPFSFKPTPLPIPPLTTVYKFVFLKTTKQNHCFSKSSRNPRMVDEIMVCVDRIIASAAYFQESSSTTVDSSGGVTEEESVDVCGNGSKGGIFSGNVDEGSSFSSVKSKGCVQECRICQEEDEEKEMEAPCACNGTLKFAHRKCIQKWCNKKGGIICEICNQVFSPNYTSPPPRSNADVMAIDIRQAWGPHIDLRDPRLLALAAAEHQFLESEYDSYAMANSGTLACFRSVAIILMLILLIRQILMITRDSGMFQESSAFFHYQISVLQLAGFLLPCYVVARSWYIVQCRRRRQG